MSYLIVFVCHDNESIANVIHHNKNIMFVGNKEISDEYINNPKIIIARNLENNIEYEHKLLTFTAWYAICKNNLFTEYDYLCILEYDVELDKNFENNLENRLLLNNNEVISFFYDSNNICLYEHVDKNLIDKFLMSKNHNADVLHKGWGTSTNQCVPRNILCDFVDWYYPDCLNIKLNDYKYFSFYHERIFMFYLKNKGFDFNIVDGLKHFQKKSHGNY